MQTIHISESPYRLDTNPHFQQKGRAKNKNKKEEEVGFAAYLVKDSNL